MKIIDKIIHLIIVTIIFFFIFPIIKFFYKDNIRRRHLSASNWNTSFDNSSASDLNKGTIKSSLRYFKKEKRILFPVICLLLIYSSNMKKMKDSSKISSTKYEMN